jgi:HlyD family secretion protein
MADADTAVDAGKKDEAGAKTHLDPKAGSPKAPNAGQKLSDGAKKKIAIAAVAVIAVVAGFLIWRALQPKTLDPGFASGNGRIEGTEIDVAPKIAGRLAQILVNEGDFVKSGQVVARMDTTTLLAQRDQATADLEQAENVVAADQSLVAAREADRTAAQSVVERQRADSTVAKQQLGRTTTLQKEGWTTQQKLDQDLSVERGSGAAVATAVAQVAAAASAIATARAQVVGARSGVVAAHAAIAVIQSNIDDSALRSPRDGRVQYLVAQPSEVLAAGGVALTVVDLTDVYMTFFLADAQAGRIAMGQDARIVLDAAPDFVIPAKISFVAAVAQFTPKTVETQSERESLMFRLRARIDPALLKEHLTQVKTGLPGMAYVRLDAAKPWPDRLAIRLPR